MLVTRFISPKMFPTLRAIRARHSANGLWFIHPAVIRMASFCCQSWTSCSPKNNEPRAPQSADIAGSTKLDVEYTALLRAMWSRICAPAEMLLHRVEVASLPTAITIAGVPVGDVGVAHCDLG